MGGLTSPDALLGSAVPIDLLGTQRVLEKGLHVWLQRCPSSQDLLSKYPNICKEDYVTGEWEHKDPDCGANEELSEGCVQESAEFCRRRLRNLEGLWFLQACWQYPSLAYQQKSLNLRFEKELIRKYEYVQSFCCCIIVLTNIVTSNVNPSLEVNHAIQSFGQFTLVIDYSLNGWVLSQSPCQWRQCLSLQ